jgi:hypothetical protein
MRTLLLAALLLAAAPAAADDAHPPLAKFGELERLVQRVEQEGFKRFAFDPVRPGVPDDKLVFDPTGNTVEKEKAFRKAWLAAYDPIGKDATDHAKSAAKEKKSKDALKLLNAIAPRVLEVRGALAKPDEKEVFDAREAGIKKFLKRYDFGPKIAQSSADGTAVINVNLAPDTFKLVELTVYGWKFTPLKDAKGEDVKLGDRRVEYAEAFSQSELREGLHMLANEWFTVRYMKVENEKQTDLIKVTGAKLLLGTYYFLEHKDRLVVAREPAAGGPGK